MSKTIEDIRIELNQNPDEKPRKNGQRFLKEEIRFHKVKTEMVKNVRRAGNIKSV